MITANDLSKKYNGVSVLNIPLLDIPRGQSFGLVGNNGAGKTTFFNLLLDLIQPTTGQIKLNDILIGEVWICSGQSNMEWRMTQTTHGKDEIPKANHPNIRLFCQEDK